MGMVVRTNMAAMNANNSLAQASKAQQAGMQKLASGFKINKAADDASGLAISEKMKNQIKALDTAKDNCEDGANMIQTAEGYMAETHDMLNRMVELSEKAANGTLGEEDRKSLQDEMDQLCGEIDRIATTANFNGHKLLDGSIGSKSQLTLSVKGNEVKYNAPASGTSELKFGGGLIDATTNAAAGLKDGETYEVKTAATASADLTKSTVTLNGLKSDGSADGVAYTVTIDAKKGDRVTIGDDGSGTSTNGLQFSQCNTMKGATFTFDGTDWKNEDGTVTLAGQMKAGAAVGEQFIYSDKTASGDANDGIKLQIGESSTEADRIEVSINSFHSDSLFAGLDGFVNSSNDADSSAANQATATVKITNGNSASTYLNAVTIDIKDQDAASAAADALRQVSNYVSDERGKLGAQQNRLDHTVNNLTTASENTTAANSRIRDTDMAKEMMAYTSKNVIAQAAQSMLAQANSQPQNVLSLLQ